MANVISFINMKGGVGKTTLAVNIGYTLAKKYRKRVLLIDVDPQMNATQYILNASQVIDIYDNPRKTIYGILETGSPLPTVMASENPGNSDQFEGLYKIADNFTFIPSHLKMMELNLFEHPNRMNNYIKNHLNNHFDLIILDCPPTISSYTKIALMASNYYVVPMMTDYLSLMGLPLLETYIGELRDEFELDLSFLGIILNKVHPNYRIYGDIKTKIIERPEWRSKLFSSELKETTNIAKALTQDDINQNSQFIFDINDQDINAQIVTITEEFMQKGRF